MTAIFKAGMGDHELNSISPDQLGLHEHVVLSGNSAPSDSPENMKRRHSRVCILAGVVFLIGVGCLLAGVVLITLSQSENSATKNNAGMDLHKSNSCNENSTNSKNESKPANPCEFSVEAERAGKPTKCRC